jgi:protein-tyrosine phosphatase
VSASDEELRVRTIARRFLLVEVQPDTTETFLETAVQRVFELGLVPVLAHPERGRSLSRHLDELETIRDAGAVVQIVAPSLLGDAGRDAAATAWGLLERGMADLLASDSHGWWRSPAYLYEAAGAVGERLGPELRRALTQTNPGMLLDGLHPRGLEPRAQSP